MGHYDSCRPGYCSSCGAGPGNLEANGGVCPFCHPASTPSFYVNAPCPYCDDHATHACEVVSWRRGPGKKWIRVKCPVCSEGFEHNVTEGQPFKGRTP